MSDLHVVPPPPPDKPEAAPLVYYGAELKRYREAAQLTQQQLAEKIAFSKSQVSMVETGRRPPSDPRFTKQCDEVLRTGGALGRILPLLDNTDTYVSWFKPYALLEAEATAIYEYQTQTVPGLLQTAAYAYAVIDCGIPSLRAEEVEKQTAARIARQQVFARETPPRMWAVVDEIALRRPIGGRAVLMEQLGHLIKLAEGPYVTFAVLPSDTEEHAGLDGSWSVLHFADGPPLLYVEGRGNATMTNRAPEVVAVQQSFTTLCAQALSPRASVRLIATIMGEL